MKKIMMDILNGMESPDKIINKSTKAVCGVFEREIIVKKSEVSKTKSKLRASGYIIIGTGDAGFGRTKIWFNPVGVSL